MNNVLLLLVRSEEVLWIFVDDVFITFILNVTGVRRSKVNKDRYIILSHGKRIGVIQNVVDVIEEW